MGQRGPPRTPTRILKGRKSSLARERERKEAKGLKGRPQRPAWVKGDLKKHWDFLVPKLESMGILEVTHREPLARLCRMYVRLKKLEDLIDKDGELLVREKRIPGTKPPEYFEEVVGMHPRVKIAEKLRQDILRLEQQFGLTPSARSGVEVATGGESKVSELDKRRQKILGAG